MGNTKVALFLAREAGYSAHTFRGECYVSTDDGQEAILFSPHEDRALFVRVILWAARNAISIEINKAYIVADARSGDPCGSREIVHHSNTDESIIAATLLAIAKARGYEDE